MQQFVSDPSVWSKTSCIQIFYGLWVSLAEIGIGMSVGFSAVLVPQLKEPESEFPEVSLNEMAWIASVLTLSSPLGCIVCGLLIDRIGRRIMQVISQLPMAIGWWYTALSTTPTHLIIGRVITGVGVCMSAGPIRMYTTEISLPNMRGVLGAFPNIAISIGITATAAMGAVLKWTTHCYICGLYAAVLMIFNYFLPETPYHVLMRDTTENYDNARRALKKFRSKRHNIANEMIHLIEYKKDNEIRRVPLLQKIKGLFQVSACKPFFIVMPYIMAGQCSGISIMMFWTLDILEASKIDLDLYLCNIVLGLTRMFSGLITSVLIYYFGRRPLALISGLGISVVCFAVGGYLLTTSSPAWYPQLGYMFYMLFASLGYYTLPLLIMYELYPLLIRGLLGGITVSIANLLIFSSNKIYPFMEKSIGIAKTVMIFGLFSLLGTIFLYVCLPETKGLTLQEIEEYYNKKRPTLVSERKVYSAQWLSRSLQAVQSSTNVNKSKSISLEHHKTSNPHYHDNSERALDVVNEDIDIHRPTIAKDPSFHSKSSDEQVEADKTHTKIVNIGNTNRSISQKDSVTYTHEHIDKYSSAKGVNENRKTANKKASGIQVSIDSSTENSYITSSHVTINPVASTSSRTSSRNTTEPSKKGSNVTATNRQNAKSIHSSSDSSDSDSKKEDDKKKEEK